MIKPLALTLVLLVFPHFPGESRVLIQGRFEHDITQPDQPPRKHPRVFTVELDDGNARIISTDLAGRTRYEVGMDSGTIFYLKTLPNSKGQLIKVASIESHVIPEVNLGEASILWLAFASGRYFTGLTNEAAEQVWLHDDQNLRAERFTMSIVRSAETFLDGIPFQVAYLSDGNYRTRSDDGASVVFPVTPPFDQGFTNALFHATSTTNVADQTIPMSWKFKRFHVARGSFGTLQEISAVVTNVIVDASKISVMPVFTGELKVNDQRFVHAHPPVPSVIHSITNGYWPATNEVFTAYLNEARKRRTQVAHSVSVERSAEPASLQRGTQ